MKTKICSLASVVSDSRRSSVDPADTRLVHDPVDATEVVAIN